MIQPIAGPLLRKIWKMPGAAAIAAGAVLDSAREIKPEPESALGAGLEVESFFFVFDEVATGSESEFVTFLSLASVRVSDVASPVCTVSPFLRDFGCGFFLLAIANKLSGRITPHHPTLMRRFRAWN